jgi:hypothetical protein
MGYFVNLFEPFCGNVGVSLGSIYTGVSQQFLNHAHIGTVIQERSCKSMTECMRINMMICAFRA